MKSNRRTAWLVVMGVVALFYLAMFGRVLEYLNPITGDEPFYVMTAISMVRDRDLDETNNYIQRQYEAFYPEEPLPADWKGWPAFPRDLPPHPAISERPGLHTKHGLGLSILIALPYAIAGRIGAMLVVTLAGAVLAGQMFLLAREGGVSEKTAALAAVALSMTMPLAPYALLIFPEVPAALLIIYAIRRMAASGNETWQWLLTGAAIGFLPWLHQRFAVMSAVFAAILLYRLIQTRSRNGAPALLPVAIGGFSIIGYNLWLYGQFTQNTADHAGFSRLSGTLNGLAGLMLDAQWGLLVVAPVMTIAIAAIPVWARSNKRTASIALLAVAPYLLVVGAYQVWWGEWGPAARYLVPVVPLLAAPLATWIHRGTGIHRAVAGLAWIFGLVITLIGFANPQRWYHHPDGINKVYALIGERFGFDLAGRLIPYQFYSPATPAERVALVMLTLMLTGLLGWWFWRSAGNRGGRFRRV